MRHGNRRPLVTFGLLAALMLVATPSAGQTTCATGNCVFGATGGNPNLPAACQTRAVPRLLEVQMTSTPIFRFSSVPGGNANIRVEQSQCVNWHNVDGAAIPWHSATEDTVGSGCSTSDLCSSVNITPPCDFETGNIDSTLVFSVCHYQVVPVGNYTYSCRLHDIFGMTGTFEVVDPIVLNVSRNAANDIILDWPIPGGTGPWNVLKDTAPDMPAAANLTPAGTAARTFTDTAFAGSAFYLVEERN